MCYYTDAICTSTIAWIWPEPSMLQMPCKLLPCLLARASCASIAVFRPRKAGGLTDLLRLFLRTFSLFFFRSLVTHQKKKYTQ